MATSTALALPSCLVPENDAEVAVLQGLMLLSEPVPIPILARAHN